MKRWKALAAALALVLGTGEIAAPAKTACAGARFCKAHVRTHRIRRRAYGYGRVFQQSVPPLAPPSQRELPAPTQPERLYPPGVAAPSPFLPNNLPSTFLPQKF